MKTLFTLIVMGWLFAPISLMASPVTPLSTGTDPHSTATVYVLRPRGPELFTRFRVEADGGQQLRLRRGEWDKVQVSGNEEVNLTWRAPMGQLDEISLNPAPGEKRYVIVTLRSGMWWDQPMMVEVTEESFRKECRRNRVVFP